MSEAPTSIAPAIPDDLLSMIGSVRCLATTYSLLDTGHFTRAHLKILDTCLKYVDTLYTKALDEALAHPDADKSEDLVKAKAARMVINGEATSLVGAEKLDEARKKRAKKAEKTVVLKKKDSKEVTRGKH